MNTTCHHRKWVNYRIRCIAPGNTTQGPYGPHQFGQIHWLIHPHCTDPITQSNLTASQLGVGGLILIWFPLADALVASNLQLQDVLVASLMPQPPTFQLPSTCPGSSSKYDPDVRAIQNLRVYNVNSLSRSNFLSCFLNPFLFKSLAPSPIGSIFCGPGTLD